GKTIVMAADAGEDALLVAADRRHSRVRLLQKTLAHARVPARLLALDATAPLPFGPVFDRVLLDAPCSGLGTVRRDPALKRSRTEADLSRFAATQRLMLARAAEAVRPGGQLIYATCSSEPDENDAVVSTFLDDDKRFGSGRVLRTLPFRDGLDAYFAAVL